MSFPSMRPKSRFCPQLEHLEDRCVPTAGLIHRADLSGLDGTTGIPTTIAKVIQLAQNEARALTNSVHQLQKSQPKNDAVSFSGALLAQDLQVTKTELTTVNRYIRSLQHTHQSPEQAYLRLFQMQTNIASTNADLQTFQLQEIVSGKI